MMSSKQQKGYPAIRAICFFLQVFGAIAICVGVGVTIFAVGAYGISKDGFATDPAQSMNGLLVIAGAMLGSILAALLFFAMAETMMIQVDIEYNTRLTREYLKKISGLPDLGEADRQSVDKDSR